MWGFAVFWMKYRVDKYKFLHEKTSSDYTVQINGLPNDGKTKVCERTLREFFESMEVADAYTKDVKTRKPKVFCVNKTYHIGEYVSLVREMDKLRIDDLKCERNIKYWEVLAYNKDSASQISTYKKRMQNNESNRQKLNTKIDKETKKGKLPQVHWNRFCNVQSHY